MKTIRTSIKSAALVLTVTLFTATFAAADSYSLNNLQSDIAGVAQHVDPSLVNSWGMAVPSSNGPIWVSDNGTGVSTLYHLDGTAAPNSTNPLVVTIPARENGKGASPTGLLFNGTPVFKVTKNGNSLPARFIFVSEYGTVSRWTAMLAPTKAIVAVKGKSSDVYKGAT